MENPQITSAKQIKEILEPIPKELFQKGAYGNSLISDKNFGTIDNGCSCALGHIHRHFNPDDPQAIGDQNGYGARQLTAKYLIEKHARICNIAHVNNSTGVNGYNEPEIKDRVMHLIDDMIRDGY